MWATEAFDQVLLPNQKVLIRRHDPSAMQGQVTELAPSQPVTSRALPSHMGFWAAVRHHCARQHAAALQVTFGSAITMSDRFLLYIDILGFSEMTDREPGKVARTYAILDSLNVHQHNVFKTIVFSDTVLVYNPQPAKSNKEREYLVWYLTEFAEDLHHRLTGQDIFFRAILTAGDFSHYTLENIECFFGRALISAYSREKNIPSIGLFMDKNCLKYNRFFRLEPFDSDTSFVHLNRSIESLTECTGDQYPFHDRAIEDQAPYLPWQARHLRDVYTNMRTHKSPAVRAKFLTAWDFYSRRYPGLTRALVDGGFQVSVLGGVGAWSETVKAMELSIRHYRSSGNKTGLSQQISLRTPKSRKRKRSTEDA